MPKGPWEYALPTRTKRIEFVVESGWRGILTDTNYVRTNDPGTHFPWQTLAAVGSQPNGFDFWLGRAGSQGYPGPYTDGVTVGARVDIDIVHFAAAPRLLRLYFWLETDNNKLNTASFSPARMLSNIPGVRSRRMYHPTAGSANNRVVSLSVYADALDMFQLQDDSDLFGHVGSQFGRSTRVASYAEVRLRWAVEDEETGAFVTQASDIWGKFTVRSYNVLRLADYDAPLLLDRGLATSALP